ncbi:MAG: hypothetical protein KDC98_20835 [Planctomycetes bacterium]|nr:hypothetical protein [Planctomycetota bacterium]
MIETSWWLSRVGCGLLAVPAMAQSLADLTEVRNPTLPYQSLFEVEAGLNGSIATEEAPQVGLENGYGWDGHVYYRDESMGNGKGTLVGYAGRDGLYAGLIDGNIVGDQTVSRLEIRARPWQFYRDGYYNGSSFAPRGIYEGSDYEGYLGFGREVSPGLYSEVGPYYRDHTFSQSDLTPGSFQIPNGFAAYGLRIALEQNTTQLDRRRGTPRGGGVATITAEQEWNDSSGPIGDTSYSTELPSQVWRVRGRYEWYSPSSDDTVWEVFVRGAWSDRKDRIQNFEAQRPLGHQWADGSLRFRMHLGEYWILTPYVQGQWSRVVGATGGSSTSEVFFGGGVETFLHLSDSISMHGWYSYLDNESRPTIRVDKDMHGEHMFYLGLVMRFGGRRR